MNSTMDDVPGTAMENLYPALTSCFAIIVCGYCAGRMNMISETEAKGINTFVGTFSLPSLIFMSLARLELNQVNWLFLVSILIAKSIVFFAVILLSLLVSRPFNLSRAGLFAIFCTQSNDFAIGYPIVAALYKATHPEYASYLYLMAPISLAILNPIAFILMEVGKRRVSDALLLNDTEEVPQRHSLQSIIGILRGILLNPIIFMTLLGILGNLLFKHKVPCYLGSILDVLGGAFSASALFLLGLRMVGKVHKLRGATLVVPGILIMVKLIVLPLVTREVISIIHPGQNASETLDLSTYGFLYGTFPSAPTVFVFATQYMVEVDLIASAMVACTFISAPLMFVSAKMITLTNTNPSDYIKQLDAFTLDISIIGIIASLWVILVFCITRKICRVPHKITACLVVSQVLSCLGAILWNTLNDQEGWPGYIQFALFTIGVYSSRLWTAILAVTLVFLQCRNLCFVLKLQPYFYAIGWGLPILICAPLLVFDHKNGIPIEKRNPNFVYGIPQAIIAVALLVLCWIVTVGCLVLHQRTRRRVSQYTDLVDDLNDQVQTNASNGNNGPLPTINESCCEQDSPVVDIEDLIGGTVRQQCPPYGCQGVVRQYSQQIDEDLILIEEEPESHQPQILRHTVLLILLLCSMFVGLAISIWTLVLEQMSGIYIELSFLDATLNFGQSLIVFAIFGLDTKEIVLPLLKYWRRLCLGENRLVLPSKEDLSTETRHICEQFMTHHSDNCKVAICEDKRWRLKTYKNVFTGHKFVDWLIEVGLARDRVEAVHYARHLVEGQVLRHINGVYHFYDRQLLYTFGDA